MCGWRRPTYLLPPAASVSKRSWKSNTTTSNATSRPGSHIPKQESAVEQPWESTPARSNPASSASNHHDVQCFKDATYGKQQHQSGAVQLGEAEERPGDVPDGCQ